MSNKLIEAIIDDKDLMKINILDQKNEMIGHLKPLTHSFVQQAEIIDKLTKWRNLARNSFFTQFEATSEKTLKWLKEVVLNDSSRLLFILYSNSNPIGCYGFKNLSFETVELDNLIRGEIGGHPQLVLYSELALISWLFERFGLSEVFAFVLDRNVMALSLHRQIGFDLLERIPLNKEKKGADICLKMGLPGEKSSEGLYALKMGLKKANFEQQIRGAL